MPETNLVENYDEQFFNVINDPHNLVDLSIDKQWLADSKNLAQLNRFRELMQQRRTQRNDLPEPIPDNACEEEVDTES